MGENKQLRWCTGAARKVARSRGEGRKEGRKGERPFPMCQDSHGYSFCLEEDLEKMILLSH